MMFLCKMLAAAARRRQPAPDPPGDTDDSFLRYTFEDDSNFLTQITDRDEENPLAESGALLAGLGLSGVVATKVADGDGYAARFATQPGEGTLYNGSPIVIPADGNFSILARVKISAYPTAADAAIAKVWLQLDYGSVEPSCIELAIQWEAGGGGYASLYGGLRDIVGTDLSRGTTGATLESLITPGQYCWICMILDRASGEFWIMVDGVAEETMPVAIPEGFGAVQFSESGLPIAGILTYGTGEQAPPVVEISDIRFFNRVLVGDERIGVFGS
jgi:hypothetical protein